MMRLGHIIFTVLLTLWGWTAFSQTFNNGDLNGSVNFVSVPTGWTQIPDTDPICLADTPPEATVDVLDGTGPNAAGGVAGIPFSGTTFCSGLLSGDNGMWLWHEGIMQTVNGFTVGNTYSIQFYQSVVQQQNAIDKIGAWAVYADATLIGISAVSTSTINYDNVNLQWDCRIITFTASSTTHTIKFIPWDDDANVTNSAADPTGGLRMGIDLISFVTPVDPTVTPAGPFCLNEPAVNLTAADPGGVWSGPGITDVNAGTFDPATAGVGTHWVVYGITTGCGVVADSTQITVTLGADPGWTPPPVMCINGPTVDFAPLITGNPGGIWSGTGMTGSVFDPAFGTQNITYTVGVAPCTADSIITVVVNNQDDPSFNYPLANYCLTDPDPLPVISGLLGGTFSIDNGGTINSGSGLIDLSASGVGSFVITYVTNGPCPDSTTFNITITAGGNATITPSGPFCADDPALNLVAADPGGTWAGPGITDVNAGTFDPATAGPGAHIITYTIPGSCGSSDTETITVNAVDDATITPVGPFCTSDPVVTLNAATGGGNWTASCGACINGVTGDFDPGVAGPGTYTIDYVTTGPCPDSDQISITVSAGLDATITAAGPYCANDPALNLVAADPGGTWSGTGITDVNAGTFDPATAGPGAHVITYTIPGACGSSDTETITVNAADDATINPAGPFCPTDPVFTISAATGGGNWVASCGACINAVTGDFDPAVAGVGSFTIDYTTTGPCPDTDQITVIVSGALDATITPAGPFCTSDPALNLAAVDPGGTWSGTGITDVNAGTFDPATAGPGAHIITYTIPGACGSSDTETITVNAADDATITPVGPFCTSDPVVTLNAVTGGGNWTASCGACINGVTGDFDPGVAGAGTFTIDYVTTGPCPDSDQISITVTTGLDATITPAGPFCESNIASVLAAADPGGTWSGNGITDPVAGIFDPMVAGAGSHVITYTHSGGCGSSDTETILVIADADATITPAGPFCVSDPVFTMVAVDPSGTWSATCGACINAATGDFDPALAGAGSWDITYAIAGACGDLDMVTVIVTNQLDATITPAGPFCETDPSVNLTAVDVGGTWSGTGITDPVNGTFDPAAAGVGTWTITYAIPGNCGDTQTEQITVDPNADASITPVGPFCPGDAPIAMTGATAGGTWSGAGITDPVAGTFDPAIAGVGSHTITYDVAGPCPDQQTTTIVINPPDDATVSPAGPFCESDAPTNMIAATGGGTWSGTGITDVNAGTFDPATAGPGTHTITYTIAGPCGDMDTEDVVVLPNPLISFSADVTSGCEPLTVTFTDNSLPAGTTCLWDFGDGNTSANCGSATHTFNFPGCYDITLTLTTLNGCTSTQTLPSMICVSPEAQADFVFSPDEGTVFDSEIFFTNLSTGATSYLWDFGDGNSSTDLDPQHEYTTGPDTFTVCLATMNVDGCNDTICKDVIIYDEFLIYVPNSFTPDGDGVNDIFNPVVSGIDPDNYEFLIFDRWGEQIFKSTSTTLGWDGIYKGKLVQLDVYVWKVRLRQASTAERKEYVGHVTVVR